MHTTRDIVVVPPLPDNKKTYIIGDVHGSEKCLEKILNDLLKEDNRLFIVGDLADRGENSRKVIKLVLHPDFKNKIYVTRGNHEDMALKHIEELEKRVKDIYACQEINTHRKLDDVLDALSLTQPVLHHLQNGGEWLHQLFLEECGYSVSCHEFSMPGDDSIFLFRENKIIGNRKISMEGDKVIYAADSKIKQIKEFFSSLPYIIHVPASASKHAFNIVHADLPFEEDELLNRLKTKNYMLTKQEKVFATWAREGEFRNKSSAKNMVTYCGHSIVVNKSARAVRFESNTINLDVKTYASGVALVVEHEVKCFLIYARDITGIYVRRPEIFQQVQREVNDYIVKIKKINNPDEITRFFKCNDKEVDVTDLTKESNEKEQCPHLKLPVGM